MEPREQFAHNLKTRRLHLGLSQEALGLACGLHRTEISLLERAARDPRLTTIVRLARALKIKPAELLNRIQQPPANPSWTRPSQPRPQAAIEEVTRSASCSLGRQHGTSLASNSKDERIVSPDRNSGSQGRKAKHAASSSGISWLTQNSPRGRGPRWRFARLTVFKTI